MGTIIILLTENKEGVKGLKKIHQNSNREVEFSLYFIVFSKFSSYQSDKIIIHIIF